jgi:WD40 repeat protein
VWDTATGEQLCRPIKVKNLIDGMALSPGGRFLVVREDEATVTVWNIAEKKPKGRHLNGDTGRFPDLHFARNGEVLVTSSTSLFTSDNKATVGFWRLSIGERIGEVRKHPVTRHHYGKLSPDGRLFAIATDDETVRLFDTGTGLPAGPAFEGSSRIAFSPDGHLFATSRDNAVRLWRLR